MTETYRQTETEGQRILIQLRSPQIERKRCAEGTHEEARNDEQRGEAADQAERVGGI